MQTNLHFIIKPEDWHASHSDLCLDIFTTDMTVETLIYMYLEKVCVK